jgi:hypothetical protein
MSFKLLAIRPLEGCNPKFLKNLEENRIYQFYNDYEFLDNNGDKIKDFGKGVYKEVKQIKQKKEFSVPENLFDQGQTKINISAIVGKNGSGKSALVELLLVSILELSLKLKKDFIKIDELYDKIDEKKYNENIKKYRDSIKNDLVHINSEIFIEHLRDYNINLKKNKKLICDSSTQSSIFRIKIINNNISFSEVLDSNNSFDYSLNDLENLKIKDFKDYSLKKEYLFLLSKTVAKPSSQQNHLII